MKIKEKPMLDVVSENAEKHYYDLDGTLSTLNSTFDFAHGFLRYKKKYERLFLGRAIAIFLIYTKKYHPSKSRRLLINIYFKGQKKADLENYFEKVYCPKFMDSLTPLGHTLIGNSNSADVLLTGCTEVPARQIAALFGFRKIICTEFVFKKEKVRGIKTDTYGNFKAQFIIKEKEKMIYYTDDLASEEDLIPYMDKIVEV
ncbi:HAD family hydrolase [Zunongwangia sp. F363]|uniref:HAD family hydrolase n=1 Tax=Autumnicola tepida TaxID=3075595 RepID=A0ABU3C847_9FLAO|nr:HAD family hydrolase [Zunongwangia sp. F363]MDT0642514.1 HAD family hydrolase [Zunongwangia sp. F363]